MSILATAWFHTLDPFALHFPQGWPMAGLRWYGLSYATGFLVGWLMMRWFAKTGRTPLSVQAAGDFLFAIIAGVVVGGRLGYALFYDPALFTTFTPNMPWWGLLAINNGGMASHGGMIGCVIAAIWFAKRHKVSPLHLFDLTALGSTAGLCLGRVANFINGELLGFPVANQANPPSWSVKFPQEMTEFWVGQGQIDKLRSLTDIVASQTSATQDQWLTNLSNMASGDPTATGFVESKVRALIHATQSHNKAVIDFLEPLLQARHPSQLYQALTDGPLLVGALILIWLQPRRPGVIAAWFLILYAIMRIATETYRMPDPGVALILGLSRGRVLSALMALAGVAGLAIIAKMKQPPMLGLLKR